MHAGKLFVPQKEQKIYIPNINSVRNNELIPQYTILFRRDIFITCFLDNINKDANIIPSKAKTMAKALMTRVIFLPSQFIISLIIGIFNSNLNF
jgi:hypothetical protein